MPRNFLVKRTKHSNAASYRERRNSGEDTNTNAREMNNEDLENIRTNFGSPDSGYSISPINLVMAPKDAENNNCDLNVKPSECLTFTPTKSPLTVSTNYPSPFYYSSFDKLCVSSNASPVYSPKGSPSQSSPNKRRGQSDNESKPKSIKKPKAVRKINFDEDKSSPVSGCIIKDVSDCDDGKVVYGDIDSSYNYVEVTPEARAAIEKIENKIGDYVCRLCKEQFEDAFKLAQHRCPRIVHVEYRCPECDKVFSCPANLASHRRWHKPRQNVTNKQAIPSRILPANVNLNHIGTVDNSKPLNLNKQILSLTAGDLRNSPSQDEGQYQCETCGKSFRRQAYLRKHVLNHANDQQTTRQYVEHQNNNITNINDCNICPSNGTSEKKPQNSDIFKCKYCASSFFSSPGLTRHINKCHPTENPQVILLQIPPSVNRPC